MQLSVLERIVLLDILPKEGNFVTLKILRKLRESLSFTEEEIKYYALTIEGNEFKWSDQVEQVADITIGEKATDIAAAALKALDKANKLEDRHFSLYEKFVTTDE